ncbi:alpha/beta hydrolase [Burkholderia multivorans]|uniref:alpha/beta hydrolase n=1 Tax=Burkholderia multivorans TaxID=87883 RepID=UPI00018E363F|nr:alpha/beta hydrolase [Burkholderia multivorans]EED96939.1 lipase [Burkholderia multivorans CGD1]MDR8751502.1 Carboxylesterase NlhH [Burkholderia multivorans]MDR8810549.1 Carboxylesterase NlhH [Burkholderia multivorans]
MNAKLNISDIRIAGHAQGITLRSYRSVSRDILPVILYFHGGGFVNGSLDDADHPASTLAQLTPAWVIAVGYSLAPEFPFPAAAEDAYLALTWACEHARANRADANRVATVGFDAGGNIATSLAAIARDRAARPLSAQALLAPLLDPSMTRLIECAKATQGGFEAADCARYYRAYLPLPAQRLHPYAAPLESRRLGTLPPTFIASAEHDVARVDGETYARELITAGVPVEIIRYEGLTHEAIVLLTPALERAANFLRHQLEL